MKTNNFVLAKGNLEFQSKSTPEEIKQLTKELRDNIKKLGEQNSTETI